jgi:hypothetical protein
VYLLGMGAEQGGEDVGYMKIIQLVVGGESAGKSEDFSG